MPQPTSEQITDIVLNRRQVYDLDTDSHIRQAANQLSARALFELLARLDDQSPDFASDLSTLLHETPSESVSCLIGFASHDFLTADDKRDADEPPSEPSEHYLRLVFSDEQAAYYQFHLFLDLDADYVLGAARKRAGAVQHLHITLSRPEAL
jgi:hypothetical protein